MFRQHISNAFVRKEVRNYVKSLTYLIWYLIDMMNIVDKLAIDTLWTVTTYENIKQSLNCVKLPWRILRYNRKAEEIQLSITLIHHFQLYVPPSIVSWLTISSGRDVGLLLHPSSEPPSCQPCNFPFACSFMICARR